MRARGGGGNRHLNPAPRRAGPVQGGADRRDLPQFNLLPYAVGDPMAWRTGPPRSRTPMTGRSAWPAFSRKPARPATGGVTSQCHLTPIRLIGRALLPAARLRPPMRWSDAGSRTRTGSTSAASTPDCVWGAVRLDLRHDEAARTVTIDILQALHGVRYVFPCRLGAVSDPRMQMGRNRRFKDATVSLPAGTTRFMYA